MMNTFTSIVSLPLLLIPSLTPFTFYLKSVALVTSYQCLKIHYHMMSIYYHGQTTSFVLPSEEKLIPRTRGDMPPLSFHVEGISRKLST